ncbi:hypothetical protein ACFY1B_13910 [Streptomyces mirabilis]|uniref:hypothetical protein n=1 Tax=Streptomyces TaxID=1883 RepID=UPI0029CA14AA|nr:hypothetical protein [Streptomyces sp. AK02-04a]
MRRSSEQYLDKKPAGYCGTGGTEGKLSAPSESNRGASRPTGVASAPEVSEK